MSLVTADELTTDYAVETDLSNAALQEVIDGEGYVLSRFAGGTSETLTDTFYPGRGTPAIHLTPAAASVTSVEEAGVVLDPTYYQVDSTGRLLTKTTLYDAFTYQDNDVDWSYFAWGSPVTVTWLDANGLQRVSFLKIKLVQLVRLYLAFNGFSSLSGPDVSMSSADYDARRQEILDSVKKSWLFV